MQGDDKPSLESIQIQIDQIDKKFKEFSRQFSTILRSLDAIYEDRELLTDMQADMIKLRTLVLSADQHNEVLSKEVKTAVEDAGESVKNKVQETTIDVKTELEDGVAEVKNSIPHKIINGIVQVFDKKDAKLQRKPMWKHLTTLFTFGIVRL